jgi:N-acetylglutamate synthase-like GNAT family acetyltransferase
VLAAGHPRVSPTFRIRLAKLDDAEAVAALSTELGYPQTRCDAARRLDGLLADPDQLVLVAEMPDGIVVGWLHAQLRHELAVERFVEIAGFIVGAACRGQGIGGALIESVLAWARRRAVAEVWVRARVERAETKTFYERRGFRVIKQQNVLVKRLPPAGAVPAPAGATGDSGGVRG